MTTIKQVTKKPIPRTYKAWKAELDGLKRMVNQASKYKKDNGDKWLANMLEYSKLRIADLEANEPTNAIGRKVGNRRKR